MWNAMPTDARLSMTAEIMTYPAGGGDAIHAYVVRPEADRPCRASCLPPLPGWDEFYKEFSDRLGRQGYAVICPDLYCRTGHGTPDDVSGPGPSPGGVSDTASLPTARRP